MVADREELLSRLLRDGRTLVLAEYRRADSCIVSTQLVVGVCHTFGIAARRLKVRAEIHTPPIPGWEVLAQNPAMDTVEWAHQHGATTRHLGGLEPNQETEQWGGHLVAIVENFELVDLSLDQASMPERGILLGPLRVSAERFPPGLFEGFLAGRNGLPVQVANTAIVYHAEPEDPLLPRGWRSHIPRAAVLVYNFVGDILGLRRWEPNSFPRHG